MKKSIFTLALLACMGLITSTSYGQEPDKKTVKAKEALNEEKVDVLEAKVELKDAQNTDYLEFKKESEKNILKNEASIDDLNIKILKNDEKFRTENQTRVNVLEQKNISLKNAMNDYKDEGPEKWAAFKQKFTYDMDELTKALKDFTVLH